MTEMDRDNEASRGICTCYDGDLAVFNEVCILKAGVGMGGATQDFIMLLEPEGPNVLVDFSIHLAFAVECRLPASISQL